MHFRLEPSNLLAWPVIELSRIESYKYSTKCGARPTTFSSTEADGEVGRATSSNRRIELKLLTSRREINFEFQSQSQKKKKTNPTKHLKRR